MYTEKCINWESSQITSAVLEISCVQKACLNLKENLWIKMHFLFTNDRNMLFLLLVLLGLGVRKPFEEMQIVC